MSNVKKPNPKLGNTHEKLFVCAVVLGLAFTPTLKSAEIAWMIDCDMPSYLGQNIDGCAVAFVLLNPALLHEDWQNALPPYEITVIRNSSGNLQLSGNSLEASPMLIDFARLDANDFDYLPGIMWKRELQNAYTDFYYYNGSLVQGDALQLYFQNPADMTGWDVSTTGSCYWDATDYENPIFLQDEILGLGQIGTGYGYLPWATIFFDSPDIENANYYTVAYGVFGAYMTGLVDGQDYSEAWGTISWLNVENSYIWTPIPEPATTLLLGAGIVIIGLRRRRSHTDCVNKENLSRKSSGAHPNI